MDSENFVDCCPDFIDEDSSKILRELTNVSQEQHHEVPSTEEALQHEEVPDHSNLCVAEIPKEGMSFQSCGEAHGFYKNYASKVGFLVKIKTTNYVQNVNGEKIIANQSILCNKHGNQTSCVLAPIRSKKIASEKCKARVYVKLDKEEGTWFYAIFEAKHRHACSP
ncbi:hypothetical protein PIB30_064693 [Stylosanthes scabra]|uniref:FAR1 domain-containing protein n=1 Tax=Stylosanthes scabra TaxID=79078 RepID=A0ABU6YL81_9FABA|nr:hypothetical protein [Stylosanthes scabra]